MTKFYLILSDQSIEFEHLFSQTLPERCPHNYSFVAKLFVVVVDFGDTNNTRVLLGSINLLTSIGNIPILKRNLTVKKTADSLLGQLHFGHGHLGRPLLAKITLWPKMLWPKTLWPVTLWPKTLWPVTLWPITFWPKTLWPVTLWPIRLWPKTLQPVTLWPKTLWPVTFWPKTLCSQLQS